MTKISQINLSISIALASKPSKDKSLTAILASRKNQSLGLKMRNG